MRTTNCLERLKKEIKRRARVAIRQELRKCSYAHDQLFGAPEKGDQTTRQGGNPTLAFSAALFLYSVKSMGIFQGRVS